MQRIRDEERRTIWTPDLEEQLAREEGVVVHPGMMFMLAKERMEQTRLWKIVRKMPKGSLLHAHCDAMVDFDHLLQVVIETPGMHIAGPDCHLATAENRADARVSIRFRSTEHVGPPRGTRITNRGRTFYLTKAADEYPDGGREAS